MKGIKSAGFMCLIAAIGATGCQSAAEREAEAMTALQSLSQMELMEMAFDGKPTAPGVETPGGRGSDRTKAGEAGVPLLAELGQG